VTGKPTAVMQRLVLICRPNGLILDPFAGSGTTGVATLLEGRRFAGIEMAEEYIAVGRDRLEATHANVELEAHRGGQEPMFVRTA
jgi:site-specific DNA-methyltransferase (adenine-specific)